MPEHFERSFESASVPHPPQPRHRYTLALALTPFLLLGSWPALAIDGNVWGGANWGELVWGSLEGVPALHGVGLLTLSTLLAGAGAFLMKRREVAMARPRRLATQKLLRLGLLVVLLLVPPAVYAASLTLPHVFVNGAVTDAGEMNANFAATATAVNDNDIRLDTLLDQACPAGEVATGISGAGNLLCAPPL